MPLPKYRFTHYLALIPFAGLLLGQQCAPPANHASVAIPPPTVIPQPQLTLVTSQGTIVIELFHLQAPQTVANVLQYVQDGFYVGTIFHDVSPGNGIAGGSYTADLTVKPTRDPVVNESNNGLRNLRGRVALAEPDGTDSGTSQLLINLADNAQFDFDLETGNRGLTVFGRVIQGMEVVEAIGKLETTQGTASDGASLNSLPVDPPVIQSVETSATLPPPTSQPTTPPPTAEDNRPPVADAGNSRNVAPGITATLDGSASRDPNLGDQISFSWEQTAGTTVALSNAASQRPTFEVPSGDEKLSFTLTVTDLLGESATDTVDLTIVPEPKVRLATTKGDILLEFFSDTPVTTKNFLQYVEDGFYNGTIFHRVVRDFVVQGGGFLPGLAKQSGLRDAIVNEFSAERSNLRETVAMAKLGGDPDSATSQFFFNLGDNSGNLDTQNGGFTVFAKVVEGMDVVDAIAAVPTGTKQDASGNSFGDVPLEDVVITTATIESGGSLSAARRDIHHNAQRVAVSRRSRRHRRSGDVRLHPSCAVHRPAHR